MGEKELDYPVAAPTGVEPIIFRAQILQAMAARYQRFVPDLTDEEAADVLLYLANKDIPRPAWMAGEIDIGRPCIGMDARKLGKLRRRKSEVAHA